ncbi:hypothetical protein SAMN05446927_1311 [Caballeronia arationis]|uniref:Transposase n=1 Tax=Caballeronia arationis TaxID=1777142 RepID=A0A7Z7I2U1_9BURK|nr:hypothetical protein SAMN05446927_1311 [Caballeronia arationis]
MKYSTVGVDIAKNVFQLHWVDAGTGEIVNKQLKRAAFLEHAYFAEAGHAFRLKPDRCFARSWTAGAQRRRGFCFYSDCWFSVKLIFSFRIDSPFMLIR